jgi:hypothetical protein
MFGNLSIRLKSGTKTSNQIYFGKAAGMEVPGSFASSHPIPHKDHFQLGPCFVTAAAGIKQVADYRQLYPQRVFHAKCFKLLQVIKRLY